MTFIDKLDRQERVYNSLFESRVSTFGPLDGHWQPNHAVKTCLKNLAKNDLGLFLVNR